MYIYLCIRTAFSERFQETIPKPKKLTIDLLQVCFFPFLFHSKNLRIINGQLKEIYSSLI